MTQTQLLLLGSNLLVKNALKVVNTTTTNIALVEPSPNINLYDSNEVIKTLNETAARLVVFLGGEREEAVLNVIEACILERSKLDRVILLTGCEECVGPTRASLYNASQEKPFFVSVSSCELYGHFDTVCEIDPTSLVNRVLGRLKRQLKEKKKIIKTTGFGRLTRRTVKELPIQLVVDSDETSLVRLLHVQTFARELFRILLMSDYDDYFHLSSDKVVTVAKIVKIIVNAINKPVNVCFVKHTLYASCMRGTSGAYSKVNPVYYDPISLEYGLTDAVDYVCSTL